MTFEQVKIVLNLFLKEHIQFFFEKVIHIIIQLLQIMIAPVNQKNKMKKKN